MRLKMMAPEGLGLGSEDSKLIGPGLEAWDPHVGPSRTELGLPSRGPTCFTKWGAPPLSTPHPPHPMPDDWKQSSSDVLKGVPALSMKVGWILGSGWPGWACWLGHWLREDTQACCVILLGCEMAV